MSVYVIGMGYGSNIMDWLKDYAEPVGALVKKHGGKYLVKSLEPEMLDEPNNPPAVVLVIEFPDRESAHAWYSDPEYAAHKANRKTHCTGPVLIVDKLPD